MKSNTKSLIQNGALTLAISIIFWIFSLYTAGFVSLLFKIGLSSTVFWVAQILFVAGVVFATRQIYKEKFIIPLITTLIGTTILILLSLFISRQFTDLSFDGNAYHGEAIQQLLAGWNPVYQPKSTPFMGMHRPWLDGYPKAGWINSALIILTTGVYEDGKLFTMLFVVASFCLLYAALSSLNNLTWFKSLLISLSASLSVIPLLQFKAFYLDGQMSALTVMLVACFILVNTKPMLLTRVLLGVVLILLINLKLIGIAVAIISCGLFFVYNFLVVTKTTRANFIALLTGGVLAVLVFGFNPFITNSINYKHPLYPVLGPEKVEAYDINLPSNYANKSNVEVFVSSFFFRPNNIYQPPDDAARLKVPFTFEPYEFTTAMRGIGPKTGGFGPLFGSATVLALVSVLFLILMRMLKNDDSEDEALTTGDAKQDIKQDKKVDEAHWPFERLALISGGLIIGAIIISAIMFNYSSYARLFPQIWFIPVTIMFILFAQKNRYLTVAATLVGVILLGNSLASMYYNLKDYDKTVAEFNAKLDIYKAQSIEEPLTVYFQYSTGLRRILDERGIRYTATKEPITCNSYGEYRTLPDLPINICKPSAEKAQTESQNQP